MIRYLYSFIICLLNILECLVSFYILLEWVILLFSINENGFIQKLYSLLQVPIGPILNYFRKFLPPIGGMDFSPLILFLLIAGGKELLSILFFTVN